MLELCKCFLHQPAVDPPWQPSDEPALEIAEQVEERNPCNLPLQRNAWEYPHCLQLRLRPGSLFFFFFFLVL